MGLPRLVARHRRRTCSQQYDLSHGLMPSLLRWQDPVSGGFANDLTEDGPATRWTSRMPVGPGLACLITGDLAAAHRVAEFLRSVYDAQDELPERFFAFWSRQRQAPIRFGDKGFQQRFVVDNATDRMQRWTVGGIGAAFLGRLHQAAPRPRRCCRWRGHTRRSRWPRRTHSSGTRRPARAAGAPRCSTRSPATRPISTGSGRYARWYLAAQEPAGFWHPWVERNRGPGHRDHPRVRHASGDADRSRPRTAPAMIQIIDLK